MSKPTQDEGLRKRRGRYARAGQEPNTKIIDQAIDGFDDHRKSARRPPRRSSVGR
jgi:hypothetical protein